MGSIVLIHGAYQGGWIWQRVATQLRAAGHVVYAPTLDGCAERCRALRAGITTATHAAETARERIARLVLVDALALLDGERLPDIVKRPTAITTELATGPSRQDAEERMFATLDSETRAWALERYTPHPIAVMEQPVRLERFWNLDWSASVIWCRRSANPPEAHQRRTAERLHATWHELDTGHYPMLSDPAGLARLIVSAAG